MSESLSELEARPERVAIVTGASSGIGRASAIALSADGWKVVLSGRREAELRKTADMCRWEQLIVPGDLSKEEDVKVLFERTIETFGRLDLLFNNAGVSGPPTPLDELETNDFQYILNVNVIGAFMCAREAFRQMKKQGHGGRIINNGSISAHTPRMHSAAYTVSKHAILGLTKSTSLDGREFNIACTQIDIGNAATPMAIGHGDGTKQADGEVRAEPTIDVLHVADTIVHIAKMPPQVTMLYVNIMATGMPFVGRG